jgi:hypothetical protein
VTCTRARKRKVLGIVGGILLIGALAGCAPPYAAEQAELEQMGYAVHVVDAAAQQATFRTTIKGCEVDLMRTHDKGWRIAFVRSVVRNTSLIIQPVGTEAQLSATPSFIELCS